MESNDSLLKTAQLLRVLSHPNRLKIVSLLANGEMCVEEIQEKINCRQCNVSQHLLLLKKIQIVSSKKIGKRVYYFLLPSDLLHYHKDLLTFELGALTVNT